MLEPLFWDRATNEWKIAVQTWVIEVDGMTILVDTGVGNDRDRPHMPPLDRLDTDFLDALATAGVQPEAVDVVINTRLHADHAGWNTRLSGGSWVPTFPNTRPDARTRLPALLAGPCQHRRGYANGVLPTVSYLSRRRHSCTPVTTSSAIRCGCACGGAHPGLVSS